MPGGANLCVNLPSLSVPSVSEVARQFFAQINTALTPLQPVFAIMDTLQAVVDCVKSIPEAILQLDPQGLLECAPNMLDKLSKVAAMFPPLSIPVLLRDAISAIIVFLQGLQQDLAGAQLQLDRILEAKTAAQLPGNAPLLGVIACAEDFFGKVMEHIGGGAEPLNRLIGVLNTLVGLIPGVPPIPCIGGLDGAPLVLQGILEKFIQVLVIVRNLLPGGLRLSPYTPKGQNC
jgi:hypothetical protein